MDGDPASRRRSRRRSWSCRSWRSTSRTTRTSSSDRPSRPVEIIVAETELGREIAGMIDGRPPARVESSSDVADRKALLRTIGYKL
ncbi:adenosine-specific kinase [Rhodococcus aetherivorans]|uniref:adenosine-specific kinase n=1 Tax=Rhodococcus sp. PSBB049 TaxID=2812863 RepID=UPI0023B2D014|nr:MULTISPECIES: adenosine-specific kinase [Rhodococcus]